MESGRVIRGDGARSCTANRAMEPGRAIRGDGARSRTAALIGRWSQADNYIQRARHPPLRRWRSGRAEFWISGVMRVDVVGMDIAYSS